MSALNLMQMLMDGEGQSSVQRAGQQVGFDASQTQMALGALLPALSGALKRQASSPQSLQGLMGAIQNGGHSRYIDEPDSLSQAGAVEDGNGILGHLFGSKDMSRAVAGRAAEQTGLDVGALKKFLPLAAAMAMGSLGKQGRQPSMQQALMGLAAGKMLGGGSGGGLGGGLGGVGNMLGGILGGGRDPAGVGLSAPPAPQAGEKPSGAMGLLNSMLDSDGDGDAMDDLFGKFLGR